MNDPLPKKFPHTNTHVRTNMYCVFDWLIVSLRNDIYILYIPWNSWRLASALKVNAHEPPNREENILTHFHLIEIANNRICLVKFESDNILACIWLQECFIRQVGNWWTTKLKCIIQLLLNQLLYHVLLCRLIKLTNVFDIL